MASSVIDSRNYNGFPNLSRTVNGTLIYDVVKNASIAAPTDSRVVSIVPVDSRVASIVRQNSRT